MYLSNLKFFKIASIFATVTIIFSLFSEFYYDLKPCRLCLVQRFLWIGLALTCYSALFLNYHVRFKILLSLIFLFFLSVTSIYHSGVEAGIIENVFSCTGESGLEATSIEELSEIILKTTNNDCAFPKFSLFGLTLANLGSLSSLLLLILNLLLLKKELSHKYEC